MRMTLKKGEATSSFTKQGFSQGPQSIKVLGDLSLLTSSLAKKKGRN